MKEQACHTVSLIIPVLNEEKCIALFLDTVNAIFAACSDIAVEYVFINDGSTDSTQQVLLDLMTGDSRIKIVELSRNFGKEAALSAGLQMATGDAIIPIDVDLQDPPELMLEMIAKWREGYDVVLAKRINRDADSLLKRVSANFFYWAHNHISHLELPQNVGDYRLMDRCVINALKTLPEACRFMKGIFAWAGFRTATVEFTRKERRMGTSKFNGWKLWNFAWEGITSFSTVPLRIWTYVGFFSSLFSFGFAAYIFFRALFFGAVLPGYASQVILITFFGGMILTSLGIIGEYIGRIYIESKRRPIFIARRIYGFERDNHRERLSPKDTTP